jgi:hypothetical protein
MNGPSNILMTEKTMPSNPHPSATTELEIGPNTREYPNPNPNDILAMCPQPEDLCREAAVHVNQIAFPLH